MSTVCIFFIGSGHGSDEDFNVLVALNGKCRLGDLGIEGNHTAFKVSRLAKRAAGATEDNKRGAADEKNGGWRWINEGQGTFGTGLNQQANANVNRIAKIMENHAVTRVVLVGHSRGAVCAMMVAHKLHEKYGASPRCHLFLFDPVKRSAIGMGNTIIGANVKTLRVLVAEDNADQLIATSGADMFTPTLPRVNGGSEPEYIRIPGSHGTMTQVNGMPIGTLGHMLALEWLAKVNVPMAPGNDLSAKSFCLVYHRIVEQHPIQAVHDGQQWRQHRSITDMGKVKSGEEIQRKWVPLGGGTVTREDHEFGWQGTEVSSLTRSDYLHSQGIGNRWQGHGFFVNEDHWTRFSAAYPWCSKLVREGANGVSLRHVESELQMMPERMAGKFRREFLR